MKNFAVVFKDDIFIEDDIQQVYCKGSELSVGSTNLWTLFDIPSVKWRVSNISVKYTYHRCILKFVEA